ncbi:NUDIX hydrolase [Paenibacillus sp. CGMCC 1.16610]|uniref:NUDIX domain-containing protein n=1 Tax=Paenibacillus anseongense TaxID=2682845 RepID=A0ABW9U5Z2_9BACL|nr:MULTISPECIES: NUDIX hydrolase [Paenibacillus]MBA2940347.1 NUDIX hydrolase [Paenibacillus sp. CGMCC 1.16610]MVQ35524.1 NUDIX domain-containing protein [Paenibacillus anseongense]
MNIPWLQWAKEIQAISQAGLAYGENGYDLERYEALRKISVEMMSHFTDTPIDKVTELFASDTGYQTPKVDIRAVVLKENKVLLVKERADGAWALPGGWADIGYTPSEVAVKETREEAGYQVKPVRLLAVLDKKCHAHPPAPNYVYKIFILCELVGGEALEVSLETTEVGFFGEHELPPLSIERNTVEQVKRMIELAGGPASQVLLD